MNEELKKITESGAIEELKKLIPILDQVRSLTDDQYEVLKLIIKAFIEVCETPEEEK